MKPVKYKGYTILIWVAVVIPRSCSEDIQSMTTLEEFDTLKEAKAFIKEENLSDVADIRYLAAEEIDNDGNVNPACWRKTRKEALDALKKILRHA